MTRVGEVLDLGDNEPPPRCMHCNTALLPGLTAVPGLPDECTGCVYVELTPAVRGPIP